MLMIRLARVGKTKKPYFRLIVSEKTKDTYGDCLEILGHMNPHANPRAVTLKTGRVQYWLSQGAKTSPSVHNILVDQGVVTTEKLRVWKSKKKAAKAEQPAEDKKEAAKAKAATPENIQAVESAEETKEVKVEEVKPAEPKAEIKTATEAEEPKAEVSSE